jgi:hypothetical protein
VTKEESCGCGANDQESAEELEVKTEKNNTEQATGGKSKKANKARNAEITEERSAETIQKHLG